MDSAPEDRRDAIRSAQARGERRCNVIMASDLGRKSREKDEFVGSAPFSALLAGIFAASELVKSSAMGLDRDGLLAMWHFVSNNMYVERTRSSETCECAQLAPQQVRVVPPGRART